MNAVNEATSYTVAVRALCEFTAKAGDLDLRFTPSPVHGPDEIDKLIHAMDALWSHCALNRQELAG